MKTKRLICALMCALLIVTAAVPALALAGTDSDTHIEYGLGVQVKSTSSINNAESKGTLKCSFVTGVAHLPESDYTCRIVMGIGYTNGIFLNVDTDDIQTMTLASTWTHASGWYPDTDSFTHRVNGSQVYHHYYS